ncbi:MAG: ABC transporter ATP-binding protein [Alphaproteobacteria bacterium]|nr:MAG: ABC transporter ATP-binding protein [Alphaproteobacteria bacterium]
MTLLPQGPLLEAESVSKRFGGLRALDAVSFTLEAGELVGLIGPNGSGKTTFLNVLSGFYTPDTGCIRFMGRRIDGQEPATLAARGIARTFQITKIFRRITVLENLLVPGLTDWTIGRQAAGEKARAILARLDLERLMDAPASSLSGGQAKLVEFGRVMMLEPRLILLDEPFGGVHPTLKRLMHDTIRDWNAEGRSIILISHDMGSIFDLCARVVALHAGRVIADGTPEAVRNDEAVIRAYLGVDDTGAAS